MAIDIEYTVSALRDPDDPDYQLYRDILEVFASFAPNRLHGEGYAYQTIFTQSANLGREHSIQSIIEASGQMREAGIVEIRNEIFVHPTPDGELIIEKLFPGRGAQSREKKPFPVRRIA